MEKEGESTPIMKPSVGIGRQRRVLLFPVPAQGHINPMLQLASILYSKGFSITVLHTHFNAPNKSNYPHFNFQPIPDDSIDIIKHASSSGFDNLLSPIILLNQHGADSFRDFLGTLLLENNASGKEPIACLITDALWSFTQSVADELKLPRIVLRTSSLSCILFFAALPHLRAKGYFDLPQQGAFNSNLALPEFPVLKLKDIPKTAMTGLPKVYSEIIHSEIIPNMIKQAKAASGIIWNSFRELEEPELESILQDFPIPNFLIGPFHKYFPASASSLLAQEWSCLSWLDLQAPKSVLYVSFGSVATIDESEFLEVAWGIANSKQPFLWVVRPGLIRGSEWLGPLPTGFLDAVGERGHFVKWAPQQDVLAHPATGAFWTHCGWNSTLESICEGVPMICLPFLGDQVIDARYVNSVWKVGIHLENGVERSEIERAIKRLMGDKEGEEMRERITCLKEKTNSCLKKGGSSYESLESLVAYILSF